MSILALRLAFLACFLLCSFAFLYIVVLSHHLGGAEASTSRSLFVTYGLVEVGIMYLFFKNALFQKMK